MTTNFEIVSMLPTLDDTNVSNSSLVLLYSLSVHDEHAMISYWLQMLLHMSEQDAW